MSKILRRMQYAFYKLFNVGYPIELKKAVRDCESLLDVGCGSASVVSDFSKELYCVGVDIFEPAVEEARKAGTYDECFVLDVLDIDKRFKPKSFDCMVALGLIEHLTKEEGNALLAKMESIARKKVIIYTPNGFLPQGEHFGNPFQEHKSGWQIGEMRKHGYVIIGVDGWKPLRGEIGAPKCPPKLFWLVISTLTDVLVRNHPEQAFDLLCIKTLDKK